MVNVPASRQEPRTAPRPRLPCQRTADNSRNSKLSCAELLIMGQHNFRLGRPFVARQSIEEMVRQTYNNARKNDGLLGRDAFMRACHAFANACPEVADHLVPKKVAEILNPALSPGLETNDDGIRPHARRLN